MRNNIMLRVIFKIITVLLPIYKFLGKKQNKETLCNGEIIMFVLFSSAMSVAIMNLVF